MSDFENEAPTHLGAAHARFQFIQCKVMNDFKPYKAKKKNSFDFA